MNRPEIEQLIHQYRTDTKIIFQMPAVMKTEPCGTALCIAGQVCVNDGWTLYVDTDGDLGALAKKPGDERSSDALDVAMTLLDLDEWEDGLVFNKDRWPKQFR